MKGWFSMGNYLTMIIAAVVVILIAKFLLHLDLKKIITLIVNALIGFVVIWIINYTGLISIPLNIWTALVVGILGLPGVIILVLLVLIGII